MHASMTATLVTEVAQLLSYNICAGLLTTRMVSVAAAQQGLTIAGCLLGGKGTLPNVWWCFHFPVQVWYWNGDTVGC